MKLLTLTVVGLFAVTSSPALAAPPDHNVEILGNGTISCGTWLGQRREGGIAPIPAEAWVLGYLTALNNHVIPGGDISGNADNEGLMVWVDNYCQGHPLDNLFAATNALVSALIVRNP